MNRRAIVWFIGLGFIVAFCAVAVRAQDQPLTNAEIVRLTKLDMGDQVIIAKIKSAKSVQFATGTDDLIKLKEAGVSKPVIAAMLERLTPAAPAVAAAVDTTPKVQLQSTEGTIELKPMYGLLKTQSAMFSVQSWVQFVDYEAKVRISDRRPSLLLALDRDPRGAWWLVQMSQYKKKDEIYRFFDLEGGGGFGGAVFSAAPEKGSVLQFEAIQEQPGLWRIRPLKDLKPGEYGLFAGAAQSSNAVAGQGNSGMLYDFAVR